MLLHVNKQAHKKQRWCSYLPDEEGNLVAGQLLGVPVAQWSLHHLAEWWSYLPVLLGMFAAAVSTPLADWSYSNKQKVNNRLHFYSVTVRRFFWKHEVIEQKLWSECQNGLKDWEEMPCNTIVCFSKVNYVNNAIVFLKCFKLVLKGFSGKTPLLYCSKEQ